MVWLGDPALAEAPEIPLVLLDAPCLFRAAALRALRDSGRRFRVAVENPQPVRRARGGGGRTGADLPHDAAGRMGPPARSAARYAAGPGRM
ncbi:MAG: hypothetical protein WDN04_18580 [Rhodospirillales bacterium]